MDIRKVKKLMELLEESGMAEIEIVEGKESVRISRYGGAPVAAPVPMPAPVAMAPVPVAAIPAAEASDAPALLDNNQSLTKLNGVTITTQNFSHCARLICFNLVHNLHRFNNTNSIALVNMLSNLNKCFRSG
jgi:hypothetical protein